MDGSRNDLVRASKDGTPEDVQAILSQPRDLWEGQLGASLGRAICRRDPEIVGLLLSSGAKLNVSSFSHLARMADTRLLEVFLAHGWDLNSTECGNPLIRQVPMCLFSYMSTNVVVYVIRLSVDQPDVMNWLLSKGADPNVTNERGVSALGTIAVIPLVQDGAVIDALLSHGARMEPGILHMCLRPTATGGSEVLKCFLDKGADAKHVINHDDIGNGTPLHYAASLGKEKEVRLLLDAGADPSIVSYDDTGTGYTPAALAKRFGHTDIYELLVARSNLLAGTG